MRISDWSSDVCSSDLLNGGAKTHVVNREKRAKIMAWVGKEILPHEADVRAWLRRTLDPEDLEDVIQETYCQIAALKDVGHIRSGRAYFFTAARSIVLMRSEEQPSELQYLMRLSYAVFCLKK